MAQQFAGAGLKMRITDTAGMLGLVVLIGEKGGRLRLAGDLVQLRVRRGQWRKCLTAVVTLRSSLTPVKRRARFYAVGPSCRSISSSRSRRSRLAELRQVENASSGGHTTPMGTVSWPRPFGPEAAARPSAHLTVFLETTWSNILQGLPECLRGLAAVRSTYYFASCVLPSSSSGPGSFRRGRSTARGEWSAPDIVHHHQRANGRCRSGGHQQCRPSRRDVENRKRIPQDFDGDGLGLGTGWGAWAPLDRARAAAGLDFYRYRSDSTRDNVPFDKGRRRSRFTGQVWLYGRT